MMLKSFLVTIFLLTHGLSYSQLVLIEKWTLDTTAHLPTSVELITKKFSIKPANNLTGGQRQKMLDSLFAVLPQSGWIEFDKNNEKCIPALKFPIYKLDTALTSSPEPPYDYVEVVLPSELNTDYIVKVCYYVKSVDDKVETIGISLFIVNTDRVYGDIVENDPILRIKTFVRDASFLAEILSLKGK